MGQVERLVGGNFCDGSLEALWRLHTGGKAHAEQGGDLYGRRIQQSNKTLFGKIQKKNKMLQQIRKNDQNLTKLANEKTKQENYTWLTIPKKEVDKVCKYILNQPEHHKTQSIEEEFDTMIAHYLQALSDKGIRAQ